MRLRRFLVCTAVMTFGLADVNAAPPVELDRAMACLEPLEITRRSATAINVTVPLPPAPSRMIEEDKLLGEAYYNTLGILSEDNECSAFFGGSSGSVMVFNEFMGQVRKAYLEPTIGMRMSGEVTLGVNAATNAKYRLFDNISINTNGPFYRRRHFLTESAVPRLGGFGPNTKEVRVLILLHELAHLMKGNNGNWLLPNDGQGEETSRHNSNKIEEVCGDQIKGLTRSNSK